MLAARLPFVAAALLCGALGLYLAAVSRGEAALERAQAELIDGRGDAALAELEGLEGETDRRAAALRGYAHRAEGRLRPARRAFQSAVRRDPNNWILHREYGRVLLALGERAKARARMSRAMALNPRMVLPPGFAAPK